MNLNLERLAKYTGYTLVTLLLLYFGCLIHELGHAYAVLNYGHVLLDIQVDLFEGSVLWQPVYYNPDVNNMIAFSGGLSQTLFYLLMSLRLRGSAYLGVGSLIYAFQETLLEEEVMNLLHIYGLTGVVIGLVLYCCWVFHRLLEVEGY